MPIFVNVVPWKQNVDLCVVVIVMAEAKEALSVALHRHAEQPRIHSLKDADVAISQVGDDGKLGVEKFSQILPSQIAHDRKGVVDPAEFLQKKWFR